MRKRKGRIIAVAILIFAVLLGIACLCRWFFDYSSVLYANWGFSLPIKAGYSEIYSRSTEASWHGDGIRYHVFSCKNTEPVSEMFDWQLTERATQDCESYSEAVEKWLAEISVPEEEYPDMEECCWWYQSRAVGGDEILVLWNESEGKLYIVEYFL
ncbi:MAG: hypothetical protein LUE29_10095 [Lachnospiraceae bacterium]|nr:hypothetical protein [Lachnospiraceae bacterium]